MLLREAIALVLRRTNLLCGHNVGLLNVKPSGTYRVSQEECARLRVFLMLKYTDITQNTYVQS